jgi:3-dehydroquinate synthase
VLNYGHTLAHAIEKATDYRIRHGEAVAIGCIYVAEVARRTGSLAPEVADRHAHLFGSVGLPTSLGGSDWDELHATMKIDKKSRGSRLRLVVLDGLARPRILAGPDEDVLRAAYDVIASDSA